MDSGSRVFNVQFLGKYTGLDTEKGIDQSGSRKAYFDELDKFCADIPELCRSVDPSLPKKDLLGSLAKLQLRLLNVSDTGIIKEIEEIMILVKQNGAREEVDELVSHARRNLELLQQKIDEAEIRAEDVDGTDGGNEKGKDEKPATQEIAAPKNAAGAKIRASLFQNMINALEKFEFDAAEGEAQILKGFGFDMTINNALDNIAAALRNFDYDMASSETKRMMKYVAMMEAKEVKPAEKRKILAVDDKPDILNTLKAVLSSHYNVYCVTNHVAALKFVASNAPDLILMDIEMPEMNGFDLLKLIRQMDAGKKAPVLFLTENVSVDNIKASLESGGNDFIRKPIEQEILLSKIEKHLSS